MAENLRYQFRKEHERKKDKKVLTEAQNKPTRNPITIEALKEKPLESDDDGKVKALQYRKNVEKDTRKDKDNTRSGKTHDDSCKEGIQCSQENGHAKKNMYAEEQTQRDAGKKSCDSSDSEEEKAKRRAMAQYDTAKKNSEMKDDKP